MYMHVYVYTYIHTYMTNTTVQSFNAQGHPATYRCCEKTLLRRIGRVGRFASKTPAQGLESSFCCRVAGERRL